MKKTAAKTYCQCDAKQQPVQEETFPTRAKSNSPEDIQAFQEAISEQINAELMGYVEHVKVANELMDKLGIVRKDSTIDTTELYDIITDDKRCRRLISMLKNKAFW